MKRLVILIADIFSLFCQSIGLVILIADIFLPPLLCRFWFGYSDYWHDVTPSFVKVLVWLYWLLTSSHVLFCVGMGLVILMVAWPHALFCAGLIWLYWLLAWHHALFCAVLIWLYWLLAWPQALFSDGCGSVILIADILLCPLSPWYNRTGWLDVKHQLTYLLTTTTPPPPPPLPLPLIALI